MKKVICLQCGHEQELKNWSLDDLGYCTICEKCEGSFDISEEDAESILVSRGTKVILEDGRTGIIDGNDFENTEEYSNINYYFCEDKYTHKKFWSDNYEMVLREDFKLI